MELISHTFELVSLTILLVFQLLKGVMSSTSSDSSEKIEGKITLVLQETLAEEIQILKEQLATCSLLRSRQHRHYIRRDH